MFGHDTRQSACLSVLVCVTGISMSRIVGSLVYVDVSKSRQTHYWIFGCVAAVGTARGGGQMKDDCTAAGVRCREWDVLYTCVWVCFLCLLVIFCMFLCGSQDGTLIPPRQFPSLLRQDVCQTALIKRQQHAQLPLVLRLICSIQNVHWMRQIPPPTTSLFFFLSLFLFQSFVLPFMATVKSCKPSDFTILHMKISLVITLSLW